MSEAKVVHTLQTSTCVTAAQAEVSILQIFLEFLVIGSTSFGRTSTAASSRNDIGLTTRNSWRLLSISQSLPGLNATNMAVVVGEKLRGVMGAIAGIIGICLPGAVLMFTVGIFYHHHGDHAFVTAALKGVAAAAVGLILYTVVSLSKKSISHNFDFVFIAMTVIAVNRLHLGVPRTLIAVGILAILFHHPRKAQKASATP